MSGGVNVLPSIPHTTRVCAWSQKIP